MFNETKETNADRGNILMLFNNVGRFKKYLYCILIGLPLWFVVGVLITFCKEFGVALKATETLNAVQGIMYCYIGISLGDIVAGFLCQLLKSRKKVMLIFLLMTAVAIVVYLFAEGVTPNSFILVKFIPWICFRLLGNFRNHCL
jgi:putative MFS transporter